MRICSLSVDFFLNDGGKFFSTRQKLQCGVVVYLCIRLHNNLPLANKSFENSLYCLGEEIEELKMIAHHFFGEKQR